MPLGVQEKPRHADLRKLGEAHGQTLWVNWERSKHRPFEVRPRIQWREETWRGELHTHLARATEEEEKATGRLPACKSTSLGSVSA